MSSTNGKSTVGLYIPPGRRNQPISETSPLIEPSNKLTNSQVRSSNTVTSNSYLSSVRRQEEAKAATEAEKMLDDEEFSDDITSCCLVCKGFSSEMSENNKNLLIQSYLEKHTIFKWLSPYELIIVYMNESLARAALSGNKSNYGIEVISLEYINDEDLLQGYLRGEILKR